MIYNYPSFYQLTINNNQRNSLGDQPIIEEKFHQIANLFEVYFSFHRNLINETEGRTVTLTNTETDQQHNDYMLKEGIEVSKERKEEIQRNRIKSNNKKKIAHGKNCCVLCEDADGNIIKGILVVFKYYHMKLTLGPFRNKDIASKVRYDFRNELFNLRITKANYKETLDDFYEKYNKDMISIYGKLYVIYKKKK